MWLFCVYLIYNYILLEISGSHSNIISDSYVFHYGNELVSPTRYKEIRHFVTTNFDQKYPFAVALVRIAAVGTAVVGKEQSDDFREGHLIASAHGRRKH